MRSDVADPAILDQHASRLVAPVEGSISRPLVRSSGGVRSSFMAEKAGLGPSPCLDNGESDADRPLFNRLRTGRDLTHLRTAVREVHVYSFSRRTRLRPFRIASFVAK